MTEDDTDSDIFSAVRAHVVVVLSGPRGPDGRAETNPNPGRIRKGLRVARKYQAPLMVSCHPDEVGLITGELIRVAQQEDIATDMHVDPWAYHTMGNAMYSLQKVRHKFRNWIVEKPVCHVVTCEGHRERAEFIFRAFQKLYRRYDHDWKDFPLSLRFHSAPHETDEDYNRSWVERESAKRLETYGFLEEWKCSPERLMAKVAEIKRAIELEAAKPRPQLLSSNALRSLVPA